EHGLMVWQDEGSAYDKRLRDHPAMEQQAAVSRPAQPDKLWTRLWGPPRERQPVVHEALLPQPIDLDAPKLDLLGLPLAIRKQIKGRPPGADLEQLGLFKRQTTKPK